MDAYRVAYDGTNYRGFQRQPDVPTVEDALLDACAALDLGRPPPGYAAAGRTDTGVSALAQTVGFEAPTWCRPRALNAELPADVRAWARAEAPAEYHATHDATGRTYEYALCVPDLDRDRLRAALTALAGTHDLTALTPDRTGTERTLRTDLRWPDGTAVCRVTAGGFPRRLVRRAMGLVTAVATGERPVADIARLLADGPAAPDHERPAAAPPEPLVLVDVTYPALTFTPDPVAVEDTREVFEARRRRLTARTRVAERIATGVGTATDGDMADDG